MLLHTDVLPMLYTSTIVRSCTTTMKYLMNNAIPDAAASSTVPDITPSTASDTDLSAALDDTPSGVNPGSIVIFPLANKEVELELPANKEVEPPVTTSTAKEEVKPTVSNVDKNYLSHLAKNEEIGGGAIKPFRRL